MYMSGDEVREYISPMKVKEPTGIKIRLLVPVSVYKIRGPITGNPYEFKGSGAIVTVDPEDAFVLLKKTRPQGCCGTPRSKGHIFELMGSVYGA